MDVKPVPFTKNEELRSHRLPEDTKDLDCASFFRNMISCYSPFGFMKGLYREGRIGDCENDLYNFKTCVRLRFKPQSQAQAFLDEQAKSRGEDEHKARQNHVWEFRTTPPEEATLWARDTTQAHTQPTTQPPPSTQQQPPIS
eukprot:TRINITY_DN2578_c0_g1_i6.p1 TRINITY_DN2578_c0_g1~~TRINITY_DN2578_c0_g1_i6.p1  ORF type:complete len:142 (-),score=27.17 TRINITY_DN2578_c0_g1_i6:33-458(-)